MYHRLRSAKAIEQALTAGRYVYFRALRPWTGGWVRIGNKGRGYLKGLLALGEVRCRV